MKVAVIGSRCADESSYLPLCEAVPLGASEILSGGAPGADALAKRYAAEGGLLFREFLPNYERYGKNAPLVRNAEIVQHADYVIAIWDGVSKGTGSVIMECLKTYTPVKVIDCSPSSKPL
jgi:hypothetical protein